jgi:hypothetical protein
VSNIASWNMASLDLAVYATRMPEAWAEELEDAGYAIFEGITSLSFVSGRFFSNKVI